MGTLRCEDVAIGLEREVCYGQEVRRVHIVRHHFSPLPKVSSSSQLPATPTGDFHIRALFSSRLLFICSPPFFFFPPCRSHPQHNALLKNRAPKRRQSTSPWLSDHKPGKARATLSFSHSARAMFSLSTLRFRPRAPEPAGHTRPGSGRVRARALGGGAPIFSDPSQFR